MPKLTIDQAVALFVKIHNEAIDAAIHEVARGRTITNFGHLPEVVRALEWVMMDLQRLKRTSDADFVRIGSLEQAKADLQRLSEEGNV